PRGVRAGRAPGDSRRRLIAAVLSRPRRPAGSLSIDRSPLFAAIFPGPPGRIVVSATQFAAGDFPPVCAMTGLPAETRRRFRFIRAPAWSFVFAFLMCVGIGFLVSGILIFLVARKVSGYLPLTSASNQRLNWALQGSAATLVVVALMWI